MQKVCSSVVLIVMYVHSKKNENVNKKVLSLKYENLNNRYNTDGEKSNATTVITITLHTRPKLPSHTHQFLKFSQDSVQVL